MILYKHKNNTDVAVQVLKEIYVKEKDLYKLDIEWWNIVRSHPPYAMGIQERIEIPREVWREQWIRTEF